MTHFTPSTIDHINTRMKVYHDDFTRIAEDIKQTTDLKEKKQMVLSLLTLCLQYEILDQQGEATECLLIAWNEQIELCNQLPKDGEMHLNLWIMSLMNAYMAYQHNEIDAAITFCLTFAQTARHVGPIEEAQVALELTANVAYTDLAIMFLKQNKEQQASQMLAIANEVLDDPTEIVSLEMIQEGEVTSSFEGNLGEAFSKMFMEDMALDYAQNRCGLYEELHKSLPHDRGVDLLWLQSNKQMAEAASDKGMKEEAFLLALQCRDEAMNLQAMYPEDKEVLRALFQANMFLTDYDDEDKLNTTKTAYQLLQLLQDYESTLTYEDATNLARLALTLGNQYNALDDKKQALKYYHDSLKWGKMVPKQSDFVEIIMDTAEKRIEEVMGE